MLNHLRSYKAFYTLFHLLNRKKLIYTHKLYKKYGIKKRYFHSISSKDFEEMPRLENETDRLSSKVLFPKNPIFSSFDTSIKEALINWSEKGYAIIPSYFSEVDIENFNCEIAQLDEAKKLDWKFGNRIMFAIHQSEVLRNAGNHKQIKQILALLLGKNAELFQSINFIDASQQKTHSDSIHMTTYPLGNLIAVWVALEDVDLENGPLHYYPGSHKLPYILNKDYDNVGTRLKLGKKTYGDYENKIADLIEKQQLKKEVFLAKKGDILIWHANLLHGGEPLLDKNRSRKSMVFHYYASDVICYHEITQRPTLKSISY